MITADPGALKGFHTGEKATTLEAEVNILEVEVIFQGAGEIFLEVEVTLQEEGGIFPEEEVIFQEEAVIFQEAVVIIQVAGVISCEVEETSPSDEYQEARHGVVIQKKGILEKELTRVTENHTTTSCRCLNIHLHAKNWNDCLRSVPVMMIQDHYINQGTQSMNEVDSLLLDPQRDLQMDHRIECTIVLAEFPHHYRIDSRSPEIKWFLMITEDRYLLLKDLVMMTEKPETHHCLLDIRVPHLDM